MGMISPVPPVLETTERIFSSPDQAHGLEHALNVERLALEISQEPDFADISLDPIVLSAAALLHDAGHTRALPSWSSDRIEHIEESVDIAQEVLTAVPPFDTDPDKLRQVCYLIRHHDQTNYSFPVSTRDGKPAISILPQSQNGWPYILPAEQKSIGAMLAVLNEADAHTATGTEGAKRTLNYSLSRGIPLFAAGNPLNAWMWEESAVGNIRLAARRALLDAFTKRGREIAWQGYLEAEDVIKAITEENGVEYQREVHFADLRGVSRSYDDSGFRIDRVSSWGELVDVLRHIELQGDRNIHPYQEATIENKLVEIDCLSPLAYYALTSQLEIGKQLYQRFLTHYAVDPLDLSGTVRLINRERPIAPPIVEVYTEDRGPYRGKQIWALVDGLHRCLNAKQSGLSRIRAIVISNVPKHLPLVPLPLLWKDVEIIDQVPDNAKKRDFRFPGLESFPDISGFSSVQVTAQSCPYFFYRDLSPLGSSGIRKAASNE